MVKVGKHHSSATCSAAAVLLTRIAACLRTGQPYGLRDTDGRPVSVEEGRRICAGRYTVPAEVRAARCTTPRLKAVKGRDGAAEAGAAKRSGTASVPVPA